MIRTFRAELIKLLRLRTVLVTAVITLIASVGGAAIVLAAVKPAGPGGGGRGPTLADITAAGGGTDVFRSIVSFTGTFVFVVLIGVVAVEFTRGTIRTMLLRQPRRLPLLAGKVGAMLTFAAATLAVGEVVTWLAARAFAPSQDIATGAWTSWSAVGAAVGDYAAVLAWVTGYAVLATALAVVLRSVGLALGIGLAWMGPIEHITENAWPAAGRWFPGLLLEAFAGGGTSEVTAGRALLMAAGYTVIAGVLATALFSRSDVTV